MFIKTGNSITPGNLSTILALNLTLFHIDDTEMQSIVIHYTFNNQ